MASSDHVSTSLTGETLCQKAYTIGGVPIIFPYKAYPSQISMMDKIVKCLNKRYNCLLESPTGSGKSLALLCATLSWLKKIEREIREMESMLDKHLNAHGVAVADDVNSVIENTHNYRINLEKYKFHDSNSSKHCSVKSEVLYKTTNSSNITKQNIPFELISSDKSIAKYSPNSKLLTSLDVSDKIDKSESKSSPCVADYLKKRGIIYIDDEGDLNDFQPVKRKFCPVTQETSQVVMPCPDDKFLTSDNTASFKQETKIDSPQELSELPDNSDSSNKGYVSSSKVSPGSEGNNTLPPKLPKIYFGTRTHKQIGQIIRELKKTPYKDVKMTILSSRERTCVHPKNSRSRNKNEGCDELINRDGGPACNYYKNVRKFCYYHPPELSTAFDLEEFVSIYKRKQICPYFGARELLQTAEIIFCPYNYLVDPLIRSALNIYLKGNIIIMDEAHNIEDSAREAASGSVTVTQLQETIADILQIGQLQQDNSELYMYIAKVLENLKRWLENCQDLNDYVSFDSSSKVWSGNDMIAILDYVGLGPDTFPVFQSKYSKIIHDENEIEKDKTIEFKIPKLSGPTHMCLKSLTETLNYMYKEKLIYVPDYRCVVIKSKTHSEESSDSIISFSQAFKRKSFSNTFEITMNFWCLNPAVAFSDMKDVHSVIVASGTLAPLTSFQSELGIPFHITLEANHVVCKEHMWVGTIGKGPDNNSLNGTFHNASTFAFQDDVGNLVLEVCALIPHGVLCFLPSYGMLDKLVNRWQITGLWDKLLSKKVVLCEPRRANENFQQVMEEFYEAVKDSENNICGDVKGALFFAVCRGKVSEGLDFADNNARAVITIGIPFPNIKDAQVDLKKKI